MKKEQSDFLVTPMTFEDIQSIEENFSEQFDKFWSIDTLKSDFQDNQSHYFVAKVDQEIIGFAGIKVILDVADIMNIAVRIDKRHLGIASLLLESLIEHARSLHCSKILLEVNEKNIPAICLYEKYQFHQIAVRKKYYHQTDDAIIMEKCL